MTYLKFTISIFIILAASRFIPHPPNFTSLMAISFYIPAMLGINYIPALLISFFITDLIIGMHNLTFFTWGSVLIIGLMSKYFKNGYFNRICGSLIGVCIFFIITNFGVWALDTNLYSKNFEGLISCYFMAIPFFGNNLVATILFSSIIELLYKVYRDYEYNNSNST